MSKLAIALVIVVAVIAVGGFVTYKVIDKAVDEQKDHAEWDYRLDDNQQGSSMRKVTYTVAVKNVEKDDTKIEGPVQLLQGEVLRRLHLLRKRINKHRNRILGDQGRIRGHGSGRLGEDERDETVHHLLRDPQERDRKVTRGLSARDVLRDEQESPVRRYGHLSDCKPLPPNLIFILYFVT